MTAYLAGVRHGHARAGGRGDPYGPEGDGSDASDPPLSGAGDQAERALAVLPEIARRNAGWVAEQLAVIWAALGRYSERRIGVSADALLAARGMRPLAAEVAAALKRHPGVKPDPEAVAEYLGLLDVCWIARFGTDEDDDTGE